MNTPALTKTYTLTLRYLTIALVTIGLAAFVLHAEGSANTKASYKTIDGYSAPAFGDTITDLTPAGAR